MLKITCLTTMRVGPFPKTQLGYDYDCPSSYHLLSAIHGNSTFATNFLITVYGNGFWKSSLNPSTREDPAMSREVQSELKKRSTL